VIFLDTTGLVYAVGADYPLAQVTREIPKAVRDGRMRARRYSRADAATLAEAYATALAPLQVVTPQHLAVTAMASDAQLISADRAFRHIPGLQWRDLSEWSPRG
jgi:predicted nucleic acid-binding protein